MFAAAFRHKTVWLSGHTGFKGAWLAQWLIELGANVRGFALTPATRPALFNQLGLAKQLHHEIADLRDADAVARSIRQAKPDFVFHLAAQPLVRLSYRQPVETYATNVMGTIHVLEALRALKQPCAAVLITTDKCYENREWIYGYREVDPLGGRDPYSSSKAAAEIAIAAWRSSFFADHPVRVASARAGNVIGGGDWAADRIVPDCIRALQRHRPVAVRHPEATRPWQHVLEPLSGYLWLAARLSQPLAAPKRSKGGSTLNPPLSAAFNFGPSHEANRTVAEVVKAVLKHWPGKWVNRREPGAVHEAGLLQLSTDKARALLDWEPVWPFAEAVRQTVRWYREAARAPGQIPELTRQQIADYSRRAAELNAVWTRR